MEHIVNFTPNPILFVCSNQENTLDRACAIYKEERNAFNSDVDKRMILKCLLKEYGDRSLTGLNWLRTGKVVGSKNVENFLLSFKKDSTA